MNSPLVVFDLDGTLVDTAPDLVATLNAILAREGLPPVDYDAARNFVGGGARLMVERGFLAAERNLPAAALDGYTRDFIEHYAGHIADSSVPFPGVEAALDTLAERGYRFAVCTNKIEKLSVLLLDALDLSKRFAVICGADTFGVIKPDPEILHRTIARAGAAGDGAVMVGDSITDIATARAANIPVIAVILGTRIPPSRRWRPTGSSAGSRTSRQRSTPWSARLAVNLSRQLIPKLSLPAPYLQGDISTGHRLAAPVPLLRARSPARMVTWGQDGCMPSQWWVRSMSRVIAIAACGLLLAACSMSMPSFDFFRSGPATEVLRIESEPPGADARTAEGQSCRTPCELTVAATGEVAISFALQGYNPQTINVRAEAPAAASYAEASSPARMQPNPVYAELTPSGPSRQKKKIVAAQEKRRRQESQPRPRRRPPTQCCAATIVAGPGQRLSLELSLAAAPAGAIAEATHVEGRTERSAASGRRYGRSGRYPSESPYKRAKMACPAVAG